MKPLDEEPPYRLAVFKPYRKILVAGAFLTYRVFAKTGAIFSTRTSIDKLEELLMDTSSQRNLATPGLSSIFHYLEQHGRFPGFALAFSEQYGPVLIFFPLSTAKMRSFGTIAAFAAIALASVTSAVPFPGANEVQTTNYDAGKIPATVDITANLDAVLNANIDVDVHADVLGLIDVDAKVDVNLGIPDVLVGVNAKILPLIKISVKLDAEIDAKVALDLAVKVFAEVKATVDVAVGDIKAVVNANVGDVLHLNGKPIDAKVTAEIFAQLLNAVVLCVALVAKVCVKVDLTALVSIVADITANLAVIIGLVGHVAADVNVGLAGLVSVIVKLCVDLNLTALVNVFVGLGINVNAAVTI
ncbi:hypothetical protein NP233_g5593 [Leucocoprinus birnbaumii]|uniref:Uncharacterized protein n=1 Tax=Leucocoprinus birnbaumii TaxID=56174 RepID=A0AAD5VSJ5_9AGAR|nr:hypothetical protein NP233_g5593 [Leucocoprinus birnbaumii]